MADARDLVKEAMAELTPRLLSSDELANLIMLHKATGEWFPKHPVALLVGHITVLYEGLRDREEGDAEQVGD